MFSARNVSRFAAAAVVGLVATTGWSGPAAAEPTIPIDWNVDATSTLAKLGKEVAIPTGTFVGHFDLGTSQLTGDLTLPPATTRLDIGKLPLANVTMELAQAAPVSGTVDLTTMQARTTASFNVRIPAIRPVFAPWLNLVKSSCQTRTPVITSIGGVVDLAAGSTFSGSYELPTFEKCGLGVTAIINQIVPGGGNTMSARFYPAQ